MLQRRELVTVRGPNCGIPATGSEDYRIQATATLELASPFGLANERLGDLRTTCRGARESAKGQGMSVRGIALLLAGLLLGGCVHTQLEPASEANFSARDKKLLANAPYAKVTIPT